MPRNISILVLFTALALGCGGGETVSSAPTAGGEPSQGGSVAEEGAAAVADLLSDHPSVQSCLDLVRQSRYAEAITPCTEAVKNAPGNEEVGQALERARAGTAQAASDAAQGAAQDNAEGAVQGLLDETPGTP